jgi:hypothetical protein
LPAVSGMGAAPSSAVRAAAASVWAPISAVMAALVVSYTYISVVVS